MFEVDNFISFHDLSPYGRFIWASPSITPILGYEPEEIEGIPSYDVMHKDDIAYCKRTHQENVLNDMVGTQIVIRFIHKDGSFVPCMIIFSVCYDYLVACSTVIGTSQEAFRKVYTHSAAMTSIVGSKHKEFERIRRHHKAFNLNTWNPTSLDPEPRVCMILNRFSRNLGIMYASPSCQFIFKIDPDKAVGKPFLVFLRADDLGGFVEQAELAKSSNVVTHMRFWFQSPNCREEIPCEAMMFGAADGLLSRYSALRFFTLRFSTLRYSTLQWQQQKQNDNKNEPGRRSHNAHGQQHHQPLQTFHEAHRPESTVGNHPNVMNGFTTNPTFAEYPLSYSSTSLSESSSFNYSQSPLTSSYPSSPCGGGDVSYASQSTSTFRSTWFSNKTMKSPLQGIPIGSINSIRNLDKDQHRLRPLTSLQDDSLDIVDNDTQLPANYRLRTHYKQDPDLDDAELGRMMSRLDTGYDDEDEEDEEDYAEDSVEEIIDCRDTNGNPDGTRYGVRRSYSNSSSTNEMTEIDMEMEDIAAQTGSSRVMEFSGSPSSSASPAKTRRRQDEEGDRDYGHGGSPVPGLQVGPGLL
ncbi:hypothetical protein EC957_006551 [Mortierella hygrophila]|uniref:PAS domain-containing protein n=1 Tax=Mortierella hygrophila TaxID=979708 RepID=A0A9P6FJH4_9FUNG|nr:hypothetical protein EC957_006551 [Mortierella hygrophila]